MATPQTFQTIKIGVCDCFWKPIATPVEPNPAEIYLGLTKGGVELNYAPTWHEITVDQFGKSATESVLVGEEVKVKIPLAETDLEKLELFTHTGRRATEELLIGVASGIAGYSGVATSVVSGNTSLGVAPVNQVETALVTGPATGSGTLKVVITSNGMTNSPKTINVSVLAGDTDVDIAGKVQVALSLDPDVNTFFNVTNLTNDIILTVKSNSVNDTSLNIALNGDGSGVPAILTSVNTTAGTLAIPQVETSTVLGGATANSIVFVNVTANGMTNSPKVVNVPVLNGDTADNVATKIRAQLGLDADVSAFFNISGATDKVILTSKVGKTDDATMNIEISGVGSGVPDALVSANTTNGTIAIPQVETSTITGGATNSTNIDVTITANGMTNSPKLVSVAVLNLDTADNVATKIRAELALDVDVSAFFNVSGATDKVILTSKVSAINDATLNIEVDGTTSGIPDALISVDTTNGTIAISQVETSTITGGAINTTNVNVTVTANGMTNSPKLIVVPVVAGDTINFVANRIRTELNLDADVSAFFTVSGALDKVVLTSILPAVNDVTLNIAVSGVSSGVPDSLLSANTTNGTIAVSQVETSTITGGATNSNNVNVTITANGMTNSPKLVIVPVLTGDTVNVVATKIRAELVLDVDVSAFFTVSGATDKVILTTIVPNTDDATMNIEINGNVTGVPNVVTSTNTTLGVFANQQVETATVLSRALTTGNVILTIIANGMIGSPKILNVPVISNDSASIVANKIRNALTLDANVNSFFTVSGATDKVILTSIVPTLNDATLNIAVSGGVVGAIGVGDVQIQLSDTSQLFVGDRVKIGTEYSFVDKVDGNIIVLRNALGLAYPVSTNFYKVKRVVTFGRRPGLRLEGLSGRIRVHPIAMGSSLAEDVIIHRAFNTAPLEMKYKLDEERIFSTEFVGVVPRQTLEDEIAGIDGNFLWQIGDATV